MKSSEFCYWLQGLFEVGKPQSLDYEQILTIRRHLNLVFIHELDGTHGDTKHQDVLNEVHNTIGPNYAPDGQVLFRC